MISIGASYSTVSADELLSSLVPQYRIEGPRGCRFWRRGVNDTYRVRGAERDYSLRVYRHRLRSREEIDFEVAALVHLHGRGAKVAQPIARVDGGFVSELRAPEGPRHAIVTAHAEGSVPSYDDPRQARSFGASVAGLHALSRDFETGHARPRLETDPLLEASLATVRPLLGAEPETLAFLDATVADLRRATDRASRRGLDVGLCHGDCHGANVHVHDGALTHFDFDCCGLGFRAYDLATFRWGSLRDDGADALWAAFLEGYRSEREIGAGDLSLIDPLVVVRHLWWTALMLDNAGDFGHDETGDDFAVRQMRHVRGFVEGRRSGDLDGASRTA